MSYQEESQLLTKNLIRFPRRKALRPLVDYQVERLEV